MATGNPTDPAEIRLTGENSFIRLEQEEGGTETTRTSHWRVLYSPAGAGHVLFLKSDLIDDEVRIYSDNIAMTRWLQGEIESMLFDEFADESIPVIEAEFTKSGDSRAFWTEKIESDEEIVLLTWYDFVEPFMLNNPAVAGGRTHGVYSCFIPAMRAQITVNGDTAEGDVVKQMRGDKQSSSACLAWSETWVRPRG
ncbi:MAG TPA: hypothetical protein EYM65_01645 [Dehalococcoidia bacterium]|nr:hypothetical protein [Dehalococcoidia bacterium]